MADTTREEALEAARQIVHCADNHPYSDLASTFKMHSGRYLESAAIEVARDLLSSVAGREAVIEEIAAERRRQVSQEGWSADHDDEHDDGDLANAAACYATTKPDRIWSILWPWDTKWWKLKSRRRDLIRAGALIVAEIERLDRRALASPPKDALSCAPDVTE